ncbi:hypothetical protein ACFX2J_026576 [Malus domestica]
MWSNLTSGHNGPIGLNAYGLYAYDTVNMTGVSGQIMFTPQKDLVHPAFEIINVIGSGIRKVGYWSNFSGLSVVPPEMGVRLADIHFSQTLRKAGALCTGYDLYQLCLQKHFTQRHQIILIQVINCTVWFGLDKQHRSLVVGCFQTTEGT